MVHRGHGPTADRDVRIVDITIAVALAGLIFGAVQLVTRLFGGHDRTVISPVAMVAAAGVAMLYLWHQRRVRNRRPNRPD